MAGSLNSTSLPYDNGSIYQYRLPYMSPVSMMENAVHSDSRNEYRLTANKPYGTYVDLNTDLFSPPRIEDAYLPTSPYVSPILASVMSPICSSRPSLQELIGSNTNNQSSYLNRLYRNPMFHDLQRLLAQECLHMQVPTNLINNAWKAPPTTGLQNQEDVFSHHMKLQETFLKLRSIEKFQSEGLRIESEYSSDVGQIEVARYQALCAAGTSTSQRQAVNMHFDDRRINLIVKCERELETLTLHEGLKNVSRPKQMENEHFSMQELDSDSVFQHHKRHNKANVARQLDFLNDQHEKTRFHNNDLNDEYASAASSPECLEVDMSHDSVNDKDDSVATDPRDVNLCDSGVCEDDSSSVLSDNTSDHQCYREDQSSISEEHSSDSNEKVNVTWDEDGVTNCDGESENDKVSSSKRSIGDEVNTQNKRKKKDEIRVRGRSRQLTEHQTDVLTNWYKIHIRYPYPSDLEVQQLSEVTGLKLQQVKKWMANKRVRNFNTLSISGNQHPIKFKFKGNRVSDTEKNTAKPNYQQLNPESRKILNEWYSDHSDHPYPDNDAKQILADKAGISEEQVKSWFANKRSRAQNTKRQVPNYFIKKFPEYASHVHMVSVGRELARKAKRQNAETLNAISSVYPY